MTINLRPEFYARYETAICLYEKAQKRLAEGDADDTLTAARKSLEFLSREFSKLCGLPVVDEMTGKPRSIEELIENLTAYGFMNGDECAILHRLRKLGNIGSHDLGSMENAQEAAALLERTVMIFAEKDAQIFGQRGEPAYTVDHSDLGGFRAFLAKRPYFYRVFAGLTLSPLIPALYVASMLFEQSISTLLLIPAMVVVVICVVLHRKVAAYFDEIPVPGENCALHAGMVRLVALLALPALAVCLFLCSGLYDSVVEKIIIWVTIALCILASPVLRKVFKKIIGAEA